MFRFGLGFTHGKTWVEVRNLYREKSNNLMDLRAKWQTCSTLIGLVPYYYNNNTMTISRISHALYTNTMGIPNRRGEIIIRA